MHLRTSFALLALLLAASSLAAADDEMVAADTALLQKAGVATEDAGLLTFFQKRTLTETEKQRLTGLIKQLGSETFALRDRATQELLAVGRPALRFLEPALGDPDPEVARRAVLCTEVIQRGPGPELPSAAARLLARRKPAGAVPTLLAYLPFSDDYWEEEEILTALTTLAGPPNNLDPVIPAALREASGIRRAAAAYILGRQGSAAQRTTVQTLLTDADAKVRLRAAQGLVMAGEKTAVPVLVALLADAPLTWAWQVEELLHRLAGERAPPTSLGDGKPETRQKCRDAWAEWWRAHAASVDPAVLKDEPRPQGLTVIAEMSRNRVWECSLDGKPRWTIDGLRGPIDATMLPGGRVLIAEYQGMQVTERDLQGRVLWEKRLPSNPIVCQRLPNGNTFIATHSTLLEVARDGREVYSHAQGNRLFIFGARKLRNGRIICVSNFGVLQELDANSGKELRSFRLANLQSGWCTIEELPGGRLLLATQQRGEVVEVDATGKELWKCQVPGAIAATRLPNGHTLVASLSQQQVIEVNREGRTVAVIKSDGDPWRVQRR